MKLEEVSAEQETKLNNNELEAASGGEGENALETPSFICPKCGSTNVKHYNHDLVYFCICKDCGHEWYVDA